MPQIDLGKIRFDWQGTWSNSATYELNDVVQYVDGATNIYVALGDVTAGTVPTDTNSWALMLAGVDSIADLSEETGTTYTLLTADAGKTIRFTNASDVTVTVSSATDLAAGQRIDLINESAGVFTITTDGATIAGAGTSTTSGSFTVGAQYEAVSILCVDTDTYRVIGNISAV